MPWQVYKFGNGYKVCAKGKRTNCRSKKPLSKQRAQKQLIAIRINECYSKMIEKLIQG